MTTLTTISPVTNSPLCTRQATLTKDIDEIILKSIEAQKLWSSLPLKNRKDAVKIGLDLLVSENEINNLAKDITESMGRPIKYTAGELKTAKLRGDFLLSASDEALSPLIVENSSKFKKYITHEPLGVILIIFPWNYPYLTLINSLIPALLSGNSVLLKPSPQTPMVADSIARIFSSKYSKAIPNNLIQVVHSGDETFIQNLIQNNGISAVSFTGSLNGGLSVQKAAVGRTIPIALELGGNDPAYVRADVEEIDGLDINSIAADIVDGAIFNSGQSCCAIERVYVDEKIYDNFVEAVVKVVTKYKVGDPRDEETEIGPVVSVAAAEKIRKQVENAIASGAKSLVDPIKTFKFASDKQNCKPSYVFPTVLVNVKSDMQIMREETFGPVIPIMKVSSDKEAIAAMNDCDLGLTASVWTKDLSIGENIGNEIEAGTVFVNRSDYPDPALAWTGWKKSGRAVTLSKYGFDFFNRLKSHHIKHL